MLLIPPARWKALARLRTALKELAENFFIRETGAMGGRDAMKYLTTSYP
jgi:hypothetical protein